MEASYILTFSRPPRRVLAAWLRDFTHFWCVESYSGLFIYVTVPCEEDPVWDLVVGIDAPDESPDVSVGVFTPAGEELFRKLLWRLGESFGNVAVEVDVA